MNPRDDLLYKIALKLTPQVGAVTARNLISYCGSAEAVFSEKKHRLKKIPGVGETVIRNLNLDVALARAEEEMRYIREKDIQTHFYLDQTYPQRLTHMPSSPILLYTRGQIDLNATRIVAIVGTRSPTDYGKLMCRRIVEDLIPWNATVVSGLAYGIDIEAHRSAVEAGLSTIGVMGNGLGYVYPAVHRRTVGDMLENGGLLTEFEYLTKPEKDNFPARNRIVAALVDAVIVIESGRSGGSMITAEFANSYHRDVLALPGRVGDKMSEGCNALIKSHKAHIVESGEDIARLLGWQEEHNEPKQRTLFIELSDSEQIVVDVLDSAEASHIDALARQANLAHGKLSSVLLSLECKGVVKALPGKRFIKIP